MRVRAKIRIKIDELCKQENISKTALARKMDVTRKTVISWNKGKQGLSNSNLIMFKEIFGLEAGDLYEYLKV